MKAVKITLEISHDLIVLMASAFKEFIDTKKTIPPEMVSMVTLLIKLEKMSGRTIRLDQEETTIFIGAYAAWLKSQPGTPDMTIS